MSKIVMAVGGNALGSTLAEQKTIIAGTASSIIDLVAAGHQIILTHGNGPQVGMVNKAFELASQHSDIAPMPFCECVAMTQGYIGFHLQNAIRNEIMRRELPVWVGALVCQVEVDGADPEFAAPTKPVGAYLDADEVRRLQASGATVMEDAGRGWRLALPSPAPLRLLEGGLIKEMAEQGYILIVSGGGGVPVAKMDGRFVGVDAVVDKDRSSALIAKQIEADMLFMLTGVDQVAINWGTPEQKSLGEVSCAEIRGYAEEGHFAPGSMLPKIEAALDFAQSGSGRVALITSMELALKGIEGQAGTRITA